MTVVEYIHNLRTSLYKAHGKSGGSDGEYDGAEVVDEMGCDDFYAKDAINGDDKVDKSLKLPGLGKTTELESDPDSTGIPQGSDSMAHQGGSTLSPAADKSAAGTGAVTAQPGGFPG